MFAPLTKWVAEIDRASRVPELVSRAFQTAVSGRPGPVALALPEDMLTETASVAATRHYEVVRAHPGTSDLHRLIVMLAGAQRPLLLLGGGGWDQNACVDITKFAEAKSGRHPRLLFAFKTCSTIAMNCMLAMLAWELVQVWPNVCVMPIC